MNNHTDRYMFAREDNEYPDVAIVITDGKTNDDTTLPWRLLMN